MRRCWKMCHSSLPPLVALNLLKHGQRTGMCSCRHQSYPKAEIETKHGKMAVIVQDVPLTTDGVLPSALPSPQVTIGVTIAWGIASSQATAEPPAYPRSFSKLYHSLIPPQLKPRKDGRWALIDRFPSHLASCCLSFFWSPHLFFFFSTCIA